MLNISTVSFVYDSTEDRIRMICDVASDKRIDLWLTRNMVINWFMITEQLLTKGSKWTGDVNKNAIADIMKMEHEDNLERTTEQVTQVDGVSLNITPQLIQKIDISTTTESYVLEFSSHEPVAKVNFNEEMMHRLMNMLAASIEKTNWGINQGLFSTMDVKPSENRTLQ